MRKASLIHLSGVRIAGRVVRLVASKEGNKKWLSMKEPRRKSEY
jgi:hypothetical protein